MQIVDTNDDLAAARAHCSDPLILCRIEGQPSEFQPKSFKFRGLFILKLKSRILNLQDHTDFLSYIFSVSEEYKDYTFDYDDMAG